MTSQRRIIKTTSYVGVAGIKITAAPSRQSEVSDLYIVILSDLLSFVNSYHQKLNTDILRQAALNFFTPDEFAEGKLLLLNEYEMLLGDSALQFRAKRRNTQEREAHEAELDDILGLFDAIASKRLTNICLFGVSDFTRLSTLILDVSGPDGHNRRQAYIKLEESVGKLSTSIETLVSSCPQRGDMSTMEQSLQSAVRDMDSRLAAFNTMISE